jgi:hypothetical protein
MEAYKTWVRRNSQWLSSMESLANVWTFFPSLLLLFLLLLLLLLLLFSFGFSCCISDMLYCFFERFRVWCSLLCGAFDVFLFLLVFDYVFKRESKEKYAIFWFFFGVFSSPSGIDLPFFFSVIFSCWD